MSLGQCATYWFVNCVVVSKMYHDVEIEKVLGLNLLLNDIAN